MMFIPLLLLLSAPPALPGGAAPSPVAAAPVFTTTGAFFALSVADARASAKWYQEKLGLSIVLDVPKQDKNTVIGLEGGGLIVELIQNDDARPLASAAPATKGNGFLVHGMVKAGVVVSDFDATLAGLRERGVALAFGPFPAREKQRANFAIRDNAGNLIQFFGAQR
ncbi:MAG TPA: VOC family protein [Candidatus Polarisedimenticolia bacterium]|jgi:catechol 2,3-dioxygenase-like lactoylglutathione lyase family enzyme|nr:VOC family protein [Candidatus Polarisedimenticolia bacterium]